MRAAALALAVWVLPGCTGGVETLSGCQPDGDITPICGFMNPEDMASLSGGSWLLVSQQGHAGGSAGSLEGTCSLDYSVVRVDPLNLTAEVVLETRGAGSVALHVGDDVYIGTFAGDRIARADYVR